MPFDDVLARRNAVVLAFASVFAGANASVVFATAAIVGQSLGPSPAWATAPVTSFVLGTAAATMLVAYLAKTVGRRAAYQFGTGFGVIAGLLAALAIRDQLFWLFMVATALCGAYQAFVMSYRFGATDNASPAFRPKAISYVLIGGLAAAFVGPQLVIKTKDLLPPFTFMASYLAQAGVAVLAMLALISFRGGAPVLDHASEPARPLREILRSNRLKVAIACGAIAQALMNLLMTAAPLAMIGCNHSTDDAAIGIQWHIVGMFLPGFFTGHLINRFGVYPVMLMGLAILAACGVVGLMGISIAHFFTGLILLGVGWNFAFVGATTLVAEGQRANERNKIQGFNDLVVFLITAAASLSSGKILAYYGWSALNLTLFPFVALAAGLVFWLWRNSRAIPAPNPAE
jgi:MFS family permease